MVMAVGDQTLSGPETSDDVEQATEDNTTVPIVQGDGSTDTLEVQIRQELECTQEILVGARAVSESLRSILEGPSDQASQIQFLKQDDEALAQAERAA